jgi:hypothetical protein
LLQDRIAKELPGDLGWHPDNPAYNVPTNRNGLKAFTDGVGAYGVGTTGLLADYPPAGAPAKLIEYSLLQPHDINEIRIFTGNPGADGRIFSTTAVWSSTNGVTYNFLGYFQSDPSGSMPNGNGATVVRIYRQNGTPLAEDARYLRFHFFAVSEIGGQMRDPFNGTNSFTGLNDGLAAAYVSPMVREIDVLGIVTAPLAGDFNGNGVVDMADYALWRNNNGTATDYNVWRANFGRTGPTSWSEASPTAVPEACSGCLVAVAGLLLAVKRIRVATA